LEKRRAIQIMASDEKFEVIYKDKPVWIEGVNENTANVTVMGTCTTMDVPFTELHEPGARG